MAHWIVTANRLSDGGVVYLRSDRTWAPALTEAWRSADAKLADSMLVWAKGQEAVICDPYLLDVALEGATVLPLTARERIRAEGPQPTLERLGYAAPQRRVAAG